MLASSNTVGVAILKMLGIDVENVVKADIEICTGEPIKIKVEHYGVVGESELKREVAMAMVKKEISEYSLRPKTGKDIIYGMGAHNSFIDDITGPPSPTVRIDLADE